MMIVAYAPTKTYSQFDLYSFNQNPVSFYIAKYSIKIQQL